MKPTTETVVLSAHDQELVAKARRTLNTAFDRWLNSLSYDTIHEAATDGTLAVRFIQYEAGGPRF